jgi:hypothetical protein
MDRAVADLITLGAGGWPARAQIGRADRAQSALAAAYSALQRLADTAGVTVAGDVPDVVAAASKAQAALIASQLPPEAGTRAGLRARFDGRVPPNDLAWIVARTTEQITSRMLPLAPAAYEAMQRALVLGVAVGDNPRTAAARMVSGLERQFNGGLTRALVVSRTEILDAHRNAAAVAQQANADVLAGWVWHANSTPGAARRAGRTTGRCTASTNPARTTTSRAAAHEPPSPARGGTSASTCTNPRRCSPTRRPASRNSRRRSSRP